MNNQDLPKPDFVRNMRLIGHTDQGGRPDGVQLMVDGFAHVGHIFSKGFSVIGARDPRNPMPVTYVAAHHAIFHGDTAYAAYSGRNGGRVYANDNNGGPYILEFLK
jgi:hypothetical protein